MFFYQCLESCFARSAAICLLPRTCANIDKKEASVISNWCNDFWISSIILIFSLLTIFYIRTFWKTNFDSKTLTINICIYIDAQVPVWVFLLRVFEVQFPLVVVAADQGMIQQPKMIPWMVKMASTKCASYNILLMNVHKGNAFKTNTTKKRKTRVFFSKKKQKIK